MKSSPPFLRILTAGGSVSPGDLYQLAALARAYGLTTLEVSNRQELLLLTERTVQREDMARRIGALGMATDEPDHRVQNIVSSLPATDIYPATPWLTVGVYLDVLAQLTYSRKLIISIVDPAQSLVPPATGNINFLASPESNYWYVLLRPGGSVRRYVWPVLIASESVGVFARVVEINYIEGGNRTADEFYKVVMAQFAGKTRKLTTDLVLSEGAMPVYEGFHLLQSGNYWLGLYRKGQSFPLPFIEALCDLCRQTRIGKVYLTTNKTLLIKDIREADRPAWDRLLGRFGIRTNLPAWHLNWQLPNADAASVALKNYILHQLEETDVRTDELSFALNVPFSEASALVVIQPEQTVGTGSPQSFAVYQRTYQTPTNAHYVVVAKHQSATQLSAVVRQIARAYYERLSVPGPSPAFAEEQPAGLPKHLVQACTRCLGQYDARYGEPHRGIAVQTPFDALPADYVCGVCDAERTAFVDKWVEAPA